MLYSCNTYEEIDTSFRIVTEVRDQCIRFQKQYEKIPRLHSQIQRRESEAIKKLQDF